MPRGFSALEPLIWRGLSHAARQFDTVWIPDIPAPDSITGYLTGHYPLPPHSRYIGLLSRLERPTGEWSDEPPLDLLILLSGPEPQRAQLERIMRSQLTHFTGSAVMIVGRPGRDIEPSGSGRITIKSHCSSKETAQLLSRASAVVCRGGYSTIMELLAFGKKAVCIPTPGQTEQYYLCSRLAAYRRCIMMEQSRLDLPAALSTLKRLPAPSTLEANGKLLHDAVREAAGIEQG
jgi:UDP:flavonoid glycosyltransferase YjiC (YdhE family)